MYRYPEDTIATADNLSTSRLNDALESMSESSYNELWSVLSKAAALATEEHCPAESKVLWLLADASSMMLMPDRVNEPFAPATVYGDRRSAIPSDLKADDVALFAAIAFQLENILLRARVCDLVWLCGKPRNTKFALGAIDAYCAVAPTPESWRNDALDCWERAISLCLNLQKEGLSRVEVLEVSVLKLFDDAISIDDLFAISLARILFDKGLGRDRAEGTADSLAKRGSELAQAGDHEGARCRLEAAAKWYGRAENKNRQADITCQIAESWASAASHRATNSRLGNTCAAFWYENAIQTYRKVPRQFRDTRAVNARIEELHLLLAKAGRASVEDKVVGSKSVEIREIIEAAGASVSGKTMEDALFALANIYSGARSSKLKESAERTLSTHRLHSLFHSTHLSRDGRVVAKVPGHSFGEKESPEYQLNLWAEMVSQYKLEIALVAQGQLLPALRAFSFDHRIREDDLRNIVDRSPLVPRDRVALFAKGLFAGFELDLVSALHILVPQVENLVRWHLKLARAKTSTLSADGVETENGLSTLVGLSEFACIFGEDLAFEIKALFCDPLGPNLRNEVAHGLLDDLNCGTRYTFYAWWFVLRLTFNTFWNAAQKAEV